MLRLRYLLNIHKLSIAHLLNHRRRRCSLYLKDRRKKKKQLVHSLAQALTLTLNNLANKPQRTTNTLFLIFGSTTDNTRWITYEYSIRRRNRNMDHGELSFYLIMNKYHIFSIKRMIQSSARNSIPGIYGQI